MSSKGAKATQSRKRKQTKDPNAPKRALSAFFWFSNEERGKVKSRNPDWSIGQVAKELGKRWQELGDDGKAKYQALATKDKARYEKEVKAFQSKKPKAAPAPAPSKGSKKAPVEEEDDSEAEDDDDDEEDDD